MKKKLSLSKRIENYLEKQGVWVHSRDLERLAMEAGYKSSNAGRRCREMVSGKNSAGLPIPITLERKEERGSVWYKYKQNVKVEVKPKVKVVERNGNQVALFT